MGQPIPPGENTPLYEGLDASWNDVVSALPEDRRSELAPRIKERIDAYKPLEAWKDLQTSGITPEFASTAVSLYSVIENNPRQVYDTLATHLGITPAQAKEAVETMQEVTDEDDPRIATLQQQVDTLAQIALAQRQQTAAEQMAAEQEAALSKELEDLTKKYGEIDEDEILMRMLHKNVTAEQAYQEYANKVSELRKRTPAPRLIGQGGVVPRNAIDPTKLDSAGTKDLVAQMMQRALHDRQ